MAEDTKVETEPAVTDDQFAAKPDSEQGQPATAEGDKPTDKHEFDKVRQQVQQEIGNKVRPLEEKLDTLLSRIEAQGGATPSQKREVEQLKDELDEFTTSDVDPYKAVPALVKRLKQSEEARKKDREEFDRKFADAEEATVQSRQLAFEHNWKSEFARVNPDLREKAEEAYRGYVEEWNSLVEPGERLPDATARRIATNAYNRALAKVKDGAPAPEAETEVEAKTQTPDKSTRGTQIATKGSSARRVVDKKGEPSDDDLIAQFRSDAND